MRKHVHIWEHVYDDVPYGMGTARLYAGVACMVCGEWRENDDEDEEDDDADI